MSLKVAGLLSLAFILATAGELFITNKVIVPNFPFSLATGCASCECSRDASEPAVRLVGGSSTRSGRLEVCTEGEWHTVCAQRFNSTDATVVCRELGFSDQGGHLALILINNVS